ncbi:zinc finger protein 76-like [Macrosteles quadrilineatus]|uniref:zinc finger protein 76-like n=1 Tax=Macrosteles quadrilineatus TaxID=74068 RepID=UPI0023E17102|nr:zinc finger protein 76-like [Macrosteles quadrilineatus]
MMDCSNSSSNDDPQLITETLNFDETTFSVLPVIVDGQTISLADLTSDSLEAETLLSVPYGPTIITLNDGTHAIVPDMLQTASDVVPVDDCGSTSLVATKIEQKLEIEPTEEDEIVNVDSEENVDKEEEVEEEPMNLPVLLTEDSSSALLEAHVLQLDGGTLAYIHSQPQDGSQAVELEDGTVAYITLTQQTQDLQVVEPEPPVKKQKSFMCPQEGCGRLYTSSHHLKVHERTHTGSKPYMCVIDGCGKAFSTDYSRKAHVRTHTGEKPYKCPENLCTKSFKTSGDLQKHIRTHTGERPFVCPVEGCNRSFTTSNIRKVHIRTHTGERPYVCNEPYCDKAFASATNYKNHIRIHSGEKPYACNVEGCNKRFTEYSSLYKHHMVHTQEKPYQCNVCGRSYRQVSTLTVHKRTSHGVIEADDGTEIVLGNVFTQKVLKNANTSNPKKIKRIKTITTNLLSTNDGDYIVDSGGSIQRISSEQIFIIEDIPEHLRALQHITDPDDEELQAALDPLQEQ